MKLNSVMKSYRGARLDCSRRRALRVPRHRLPALGFRGHHHRLCQQWDHGKSGCRRAGCSYRARPGHAGDWTHQDRRRRPLLDRRSRLRHASDPRRSPRRCLLPAGSAEYVDRERPGLRCGSGCRRSRHGSQCHAHGDRCARAQGGPELLCQEWLLASAHPVQQSLLRGLYAAWRPDRRLSRHGAGQYARAIVPDTAWRRKASTRSCFPCVRERRSFNSAIIFPTRAASPLRRAWPPR